MFHFRRWLQKFKSNPEIRTIRRAVITKPEFDYPRHLLFGAVYDRGRLVRGSTRAVKNDWPSADLPNYSGATPGKKLERAIYLGHFFGHFGHFLTETLPALHWAGEYDGPIVVHPFADVVSEQVLDREFISFTLEALHIPRERLVFAWEPLCVGRLTVPRRPTPREPIPETLKVFDRLHDYAGATSGPDRIYLSRRKYSSDRLIVKNEEEAERIFAAHGFHIVYPETLPFRAQIALVAGAKIIAGLKGSALHLTVFMRKGSAVWIVSHRRMHVLDAINHARGVDTHMLGGVKHDRSSMPRIETIDADSSQRSVAMFTQ